MRVQVGLWPRAPHGGENAQVHTHTRSSFTHAPVHRDCPRKPRVEMTALGEVTATHARQTGYPCAHCLLQERLVFVFMFKITDAKSGRNSLGNCRLQNG